LIDKLSYEVIIIGGGPAGLAAGLYTARAGMESLLIEKLAIGGLIVNAELVENFPGFPAGIGGLELTDLMLQQATKFGLQTLLAEVTGIELKKDGKLVKTTEGDIMAKAIVVAGGSKRQKLGVPGEAEFTGKGVSYCATCDAPLFRDKTVAVVGGGNAAVSEALHTAKFASEVVLIHRRHELRASAILQERIFAEPKIEFLWDTTVDRIEGKNFVERIRLNQVNTGKKSSLKVAGVFVSIGIQPDTDYLKGIVPLDSAGYIITDKKMQTEVPGIFAAGDIRQDSIRQSISAAGDGATAAVYAHRFLAEL
jgi:thioredoxin reductase (NADPH)